MTAIMIIVATLFGGLCWAGRSQRRVTYYNQDIDDVEAFCDDIGCDDTCASDEYQSDTSATGDRIDRLLYVTLAVALVSVLLFDGNFAANLSRAGEVTILPLNNPWETWLCIIFAVAVAAALYQERR